VSAWKGQSRGNVLGYRIFVTLLRYGGLVPAYFILLFVALYFFLFAPASFRNIYGFYRQRMGFGRLRSLAAVYRNYFVFGQVMLDKTASMGGLGARFTFDFDGEDHLHRMVADQSGCLLISAHIGNFEMAGHMLERLHAPVHVLMLDAEHQAIKRYLSSVTQKSFNVIPIRDDNSHIFEIRRVLEAKEVLCMHGDRFVAGSKTITCDFMGYPARFPTGPFYLAMKYGVPVSFVFAMKEGSRHYHFQASIPRVYAQPRTPADRDAQLRQIITDYVAEMEVKLRRYPYQWFNYYDFWSVSE
jgi:predicted LPLAT superfamily acyltransferase